MVKNPPTPAQSAPEPLGAEAQPVGVTAEESRGYLEAIAHNYAQYVATGPIYFGNALAFNADDPVPADYPTIKQLLADGMVKAVKPAAKSGK
jgi:hypothetical protein